ncbi:MULTISPECIES: Uma2 family endonuclease [unclassified Microcoleus]|uniref:Uma2 family endonuclease n=1 Tax=unclassified Microcoleus TaxID=2642155 RepID=UPI002FD2FBB3
MLNYNLPTHCPSAEEELNIYQAPADNELKELIPGLLKAILLILWAERMDGFLGIHMGIYDDSDQQAIVPDAFFSLDIERFYDENLRSNYLLEDENVIPSFVLELLSASYHQKYTVKWEKYKNLGILYYVVYFSSRRYEPRFQVYKLVNGSYELQPGNLVWMPEIGLGIGCERGNYSGVTREWLYWYDADGKRYLTPEEQVKESAQRLQQEFQRAQQEAQRAQQEAQRAQQEAQRAQQEAQRADQLAERLRELGIDPDNIS